MSSETDESLNLITINEDCKELIFRHLEWIDLINVADTSKQLYASVCRIFNRKYGGSNSRIDFGLPYINLFDEKKYHQLLQPEPTICVTHPALALKMLRNFGHLIVNLSLDYILFYTPDIEFNNSCGGIELIKMIEEYLAEYCSGTLCQLSLQNSDRHYPILKDIKKQFLKVKTLQTDHCYFGEELPFNKFFPNLQTLNLGFNHFENKSHIVHLRTVKNLSIDFLHIKFEEENIQEFFKLNLQLERAKICLIRGFNPDLFPRLKEICPNVKSVFVLRSPFHYDEFVCGDLEYETKKKYQYLANTSDTYKKNLENLYYRYRKNLTGVDVRKQTYD